MARQESACWRCDSRWASEVEPRIALRVIHGGASDEARVYVERWVDEGVSLGAEATGPAPAAVESG